MAPALWVLAGGNGAGKSTFYRTRLAPHGIEFVNADLIERTLDPAAGGDSYVAAEKARQRFADLVQAGRPFCYETVFSHGSKLDMLVAAKRAGYHITLVVIRLATAELNVARVAQRVTERGHGVPEQKIVSRLPRTHALLRQAVQIVDTSLLLDNSSRDDPFRVIAKRHRGTISSDLDPVPDWAQELLTPPL